MKKIHLRNTVILLALSATLSVYAIELSTTPLGVAHPVAITISFTHSTHVTDVGFRLAHDNECGPEVTSSYTGGPGFHLVTPPQQVAYFNGFLPALKDQLDPCNTLDATGTIALDGVVTEGGNCTIPDPPGCYQYTCAGGNIISISPPSPTFTAAC